MTLADIQLILEQAKEIKTLEWIYFEGGEPFLYYPILLRGVQMAAAMGFHVGLVSNSYWANSVEDAIEWLKPFSGLIQDLSVSSDLYHFSEKLSNLARNAISAAGELNIPIGIISVTQPQDTISSEPGIGDYLLVNLG